MPVAVQGRHVKLLQHSHRSLVAAIAVVESHEHIVSNPAAGLPQRRSVQRTGNHELDGTVVEELVKRYNQKLLMGG